MSIICSMHFNRIFLDKSYIKETLMATHCYQLVDLYYAVLITGTYIWSLIPCYTKKLV